MNGSSGRSGDTDWRSLLCSLPGYDPYRDAVDCHFDATAAQRAIDFFPRYLRHVEGDCAGKPFVLERWQQATVANLFGWQKKDARGRTVRRYRELFLYVARKNGKTPFAAGLCLFVLLCDGERGAQIYSAAAEREQAALLFRHAKGMVEQSPSLSERCRVYGSVGFRSIVLNADPASSYKVLSADAPSKHGQNSHLVLIDELHAQPNRELVDVLTTSTAGHGRRQPLLIHLTTADFMRPSICNEKYDYACKVRDGIIVDSSFLPVVYETKPEEDWTSEEVWKRANPNIGVSVSLDYLRRECARAKETPAYENTFKRLHLNLRTEQDVRAIPMERWDAAGGVDPVAWRARQLHDLRNQPCLAGLDLGSTSDLTALALIFGQAAPHVVLPFFWVPKDSARKRERRDRVPYETWIRQGFINPTEGDTTDYDKVRLDINELANQYALREIAVDRLFQGAQLCTQLQGDGFEVIAFGQGFFSMAAPTKHFLELVLSGHLHHGANPVLRWMASNAATESDAAGNLKFSKKKSAERIDGIVAVTMALGRLLVQPPGSVYEDRGIDTLGAEAAKAEPQAPAARDPVWDWDDED